jgi:hypothetical protein
MWSFTRPLRSLWSFFTGDRQARQALVPVRHEDKTASRLRQLLEDRLLVSPIGLLASPFKGLLGWLSGAHSGAPACSPTLAKRWTYLLRLEELEPRWVPASPIATAQAAYGQLPRTFEPNQGQANAAVQFVSQGNNYGVFLTPSEAVLTLTTPVAGSASSAAAASPSGSVLLPSSPLSMPPTADNGVSQAPQAGVLQMQFIGANPNPTIVGLDPLAGTSNYISGNDPTQWHTGVTQYSEVEYENLYPGVNLVFYGNSQQLLQYDFQLAPGADPSQIKLNFQGASSVQLDAQGNLDMQVAGTPVVEHAPVVYQTIDGTQKNVSGQYVVQGPTQFGFALGGYDTTQPLTIDPTLTYSTYVGGNSTDFGLGIAVNAAGDTYITGLTASFNFPTTNGSLQTTEQGNYDVFVTELHQA